jgi:hypothetical protein
VVQLEDFELETAMKLLSWVLTLGLAAATSQAQPPAGIIWTDPGTVASRDLFWGIGSEARAPKPPFAFVEENLKGTTPKLVVKDAAGVLWDVKFEAEAHSEVAANRLMWAFGYPVEEMYYVHNGTVTGVRNLKRAGKGLTEGGRFENGARFKRRDPNITKEGGWTLAANPFKDQQAFSGLLILLALTNNWDTDLDKNTEIFTVKQPDGSVQRLYMVGDLGASFGRFDKPPKKWMLDEYRKDKLIATVEPDAIVLNYRAYGTPPTRIPMEHARWFAKMASQLTRVQVRAAFEAAGTPAADIEGFVDVFMSKLEELKTAVGGSAGL